MADSGWRMDKEPYAQNLCAYPLSAIRFSPMLYRALADTTLVVHLFFVVFVALGGLLVLRWHWVAWLHLPAALWGAFVELTGRICPLTPLEVWLRELGGEQGYEGGFIEHYITSWIYPEGLTREMQLGLGIGVLVINVVVYGIVLFRARQRRTMSRVPPP